MVNGYFYRSVGFISVVVWSIFLVISVFYIFYCVFFIIIYNSFGEVILVFLEFIIYIRKLS